MILLKKKKKKTLKIELPYDPEIPLLGTYPEKTIIQKTHALCVHCSTAYYRQDIETTKIPIKR